VITITNNSAKTQSLEVSLGDWNRKVDGAHDYFKPNTKPYSCASWLTFDKNFIEIPAGKSGEITLTMQAPDNGQELVGDAICTKCKPQKTNNKWAK